MPADNIDNIVINDFESLTRDAACARLADIHCNLPPGVSIEFTCLNFEWVVIEYRASGGQSPMIARALFDRPRAAIWTEKALVRALFAAGFRRIWTGYTTPEMPWLITAKAGIPEGASIASRAA